MVNYFIKRFLTISIATDARCRGNIVQVVLEQREALTPPSIPVRPSIFLEVDKTITRTE